jgi:V8-like Glu-specific endopeptidase
MLSRPRLQSRASRACLAALLLAALLVVTGPSTPSVRAQLPDPYSMVTVEVQPGPGPLGRAPDEATTLRSSTIFGADDRVRVDSTAQGWRTIAQIQAHDGSGGIVLCSGVMLNPSVLLTAAHCLQMPGKPPTVHVLVVPGANHPDAPFGIARATRFVYPAGWLQSGTPNPAFDYGLVFLDGAPFGDRLAPYFTVAAMPDSFFDDPATFLRTVGFPGDKPFGSMWSTDSREFQQGQTYLATALDIVSGQSGSPVLAINGETFVVSVVSRGLQTQNSSVRFTAPIIEALRSACQANGCTFQSRVVPEGMPPAAATPSPLLAAPATATEVAPAVPSAASSAPVQGAFTVTPNGAYAAGANAVVVQGSGSAASVASNVATSSGKAVVALWLLAGGQWTFFLPPYPGIDGGLAAFPGPVASSIAVLG